MLHAHLAVKVQAKYFYKDWSEKHMQFHVWFTLVPTGNVSLTLSLSP